MYNPAWHELDPDEKQNVAGQLHMLGLGCLGGSTRSQENDNVKIIGTNKPKHMCCS